MSLGPDEKLQRAPGLEVAEIDGETALFSLERGAYYGLNEVGTRIWSLLKAPASPADVCARLVAEYEIDEEACQADVLPYLDNLLVLGIVERSRD